MLHILLYLYGRGGIKCPKLHVCCTGGGGGVFGKLKFTHFVACRMGGMVGGGGVAKIEIYTFCCSSQGKGGSVY